MTMPPSNPKPNESESDESPATIDESPATIAMLAARFLPPIKLPDDWESLHPEVLQHSLAVPTGTPFPHNAGWRPEPGLRLQWEVVCEEAVKRARMLLDAAAGKVRPEVAAWDSATAGAPAEWQAQDLAAEELREEFDKLAEGEPSLTVQRVLKYCMPGVKAASAMRYFMRYLRESPAPHDAAKDSDGNVIIPDQSGRMVDRWEFPLFVTGFLKAYEERKDAWYKAFQRESGKEGQAKQAAAKKADGQAVPALTAKDDKLLSAAAEKHTTKKPRKKRASGN
jgi:hypothetical protein